MACETEPGMQAPDSWLLRFLEDTRLEARDHLRTIIAAYDAVKDKHPLPTVLVCALEEAKRSMG